MPRRHWRPSDFPIAREVDTLVVHDGDYAALLLQALRSLNHEAAHTPSLSAARRKLKEFSPDLVLIDSNPRDGDGLELCREIRKEPRVSRALIFIFTNSRHVLEGSAWSAAGADHCYPRILNPTRLSLTIGSWLKRRAFDSKMRIFNTPGLLIDPLENTVELDGAESARLSDRELLFMDYLCGDPGDVLTHDTIRARIFDKPLPREYEHAIREFVRRLKKKLPENLRARVECVYRRGYRLAGARETTILRPAQS